MSNTQDGDCTDEDKGLVKSIVDCMNSSGDSGVEKLE